MTDAAVKTQVDPNGLFCTLALILVIAFGCNRNSKSESNPETTAGKALRARSENGNDGKLFQRLTPAESGIDFQIVWDKPAKFDRVFYSQNTGGGVCIGDYNGDTLPDIYLTRPSHGNRLYKNLGGLRFEDVTQSARLQDESFWGTGASFVDIDNDGDLDIYACGYNCDNRLYINQGDGTFREKADTVNLNYRGASVMMAFADYDCDGDLDGYLVTAGIPPGPNQKFGVVFEGNKPVIPEELREYWQLLYLPEERAKQIEAGQYDHLFQNNGIGSDGLPRFTDVTKTAGITGTDLGQAATWWDYDADGLPDVYVANDYWGSDKLYHNNGNGTFTDVAKTAFAHTPWSSMGVDVADINGDGLFDFMATDMAGSNHFRQKVGMGDMSSSGWFLEYAEPRQYSRNAVYLNTGTERFMEAAFLTGVNASDWTWTPRFDDYDNDGLIDLVITNGMTRDFTNSDLNQVAKKQAVEGSPEFFRFWRKQDYRRDQNLAFQNLGQCEFVDVSKKWGFDRTGVSFGAATGDLDQDGDLEIVVNNMDAPAYIYRNNSQSGNCLRVALRGVKSNRLGLGAVVSATVAGTTQVRYMTLSRGWTSTSEPVLHFGIGNADTVDRLEIRWPGGSTQIIQSLAANQLYTIVEDAQPANSEPTKSSMMFVTSSAMEAAKPHSEVPFDDYARQPLLPNKCSQLGPGMACGDVNGDGFDDMFLAGAAGESGQLMINTGKGGFENKKIENFSKDSQHEDMGAIFFDADGDGDEDLYVVSGGVECEQNHWLQDDRLYINDGKANFQRSDFGVLGRRDSGSVVCSADFDRDGDLDLFVGGRVVPGQYPVSPNSSLLQNENGVFKEVTNQFAPKLAKAGMVTSAIWTDANRDGWVDLLVTCDWGPVRFFRNESGKLVEHTESSRLSARTGWWNGISAADLDGDDDIDYVVTNFGLNTKYHASIDHPARLYYGDFGSGQMRIVEAEHEGDKLFPVRGKSCSTNAMPFLASKFKTFTQFGLAELDKIYTNECLNGSLSLQINTLESGVLLNDGSANFEFRALPRIAQIAPGFGTTLTDVDGDGDEDLFLVHNFYGPQRETGHMDGGVSMLFLNDGHANFQAVWPNKSGIVVPTDGKSVAAIDITNDGRKDFVVGVNNSHWLAFENRIASKNDFLRLRLKGKHGNTRAVGAALSLVMSDSSIRRFEIYAGGGYLSQSSQVISVGPTNGTGDAMVESVRVAWPDGTISTHSVQGSDSVVTIVQND